MLNTAHKLQRRRQTGNDDGFTLIELLIVIVVLGILAAIVVFALGGVTGQSAVAACNSDAKTVSTAISAYEAQSASPSVQTISSLISGGYLKSAPATTYYTIGLSGTATNQIVTVALVAGDQALPSSGTAWTGANGSGTAAAVVAAQAYNYEGANAFSFATGSAGSGICAGA